MPQVREAGAELVAISPQLGEWNAKIVRRHGLEFDVLSDAGNAYSRQWGLDFAIEGDLREVYEGSFKLDLSRFNGDSSWTLPMPARIVLDQKGRIAAVDADPDYTRRPEPEETIKVLRSL